MPKPNPEWVKQIINNFHNRLCELDNLGTTHNSIIVAVIVLKTKRDTNGNPRKLLLAYDVLKDELLAVVKVGYVNIGAIIDELKRNDYTAAVRMLCEINVAPKEYNETIRLAKSLDYTLTEL